MFSFACVDPGLQHAACLGAVNKGRSLAGFTPFEQPSDASMLPIADQAKDGDYVKAVRVPLKTVMQLSSFPCIR